MVEGGADIVGRLVREGVIPHELQDLRLGAEQTVDQRDKPGVVLVVAEGRKPHLPV